MRVYLYAAAGVIFALWASLQFLGAAGFAAFVAGMIAAQLTFRVRPSLNSAFVIGLLTYALTLAIWSATIGPPRPSDNDSTPIPIATIQP
jgi:hypothetical protein